MLKMFDPEFNARAISARRRVTGNPWFKRGTLFSHALDALRMATAPMSVTEIAAAMLAAKGVKPTTKQRKGIEAGVQCSLENRGPEAVEASLMNLGHPVGDKEVTRQESTLHLSRCAAGGAKRW